MAYVSLMAEVDLLDLTDDQVIAEAKRRNLYQPNGGLLLPEDESRDAKDAADRREQAYAHMLQAVLRGDKTLAFELLREHLADAYGRATL